MLGLSQIPASLFAHTALTLSFIYRKVRRKAAAKKRPPATGKKRRPPAARKRAAGKKKARGKKT